LRIERRDVDFENFLLTVRHGKGNKERKVPISANGRKILFRFMSKPGSPSYVFGTRTGTQVQQRNAERDLKTLSRKLGFGKVYWHLLRHTFGTLFIRNGGNVADLQRIMDHAAITTTMLYVHNQTEHFVQAHILIASPFRTTACWISKLVKYASIGKTTELRVSRKR
jgi:site-specific recombinase XerD